ncbi:TonB-dependent receptor [Opitutus sp. ER46]|uniref:TonB-dependent receptor plug domain-containing protein n=1 Tax=Opitutus sp. ER46 TaxID=2161864 RepID=UPI000D30A505|nr:TonB-dependent receptor [Opitutus sp. ER46]PTX91506.1 hypothetical protein DB354_16595 [Opitutus sp. ER46]
MNKSLLQAASSALRLTALFGLTVGIASAQSSSTQNQTKKDEPQKLEAYEVTGSRIKRIDSEGPNPVAAFTQEDLTISGYGTVGEALRSMPMVSGSSLMPNGSNNSFTPGASTVNMRGLGNNNVLVLLNGRRAAPLSSPGFNGLQTVFDLDSIPAGAVEAIEVLKDGGSAIYGSDAVSGVINVKLKKNYSGLTTNVEIGNTVKTDSLEKSFSVVAGASDAKNSIVAVVDWKERNSIKDHDYNFSSQANTTALGGDDFRSYAGFPALAYVPSLGDYYTLAAPKANPTRNDFVVADVSHGTYNFQNVTDLAPATRKYGFYTRGRHDFNPNIYAFTEVSFRRTRTTIDAAPAPVFSYSENGTGPNTGALTIPSWNPNNPFGENLEDEWYARLVSAGNRINDVTSDSPRVLVGLGGEIPGSNNWTWESGYVYSSNETSNLNRGTVFDDLYQKALNGVTIGGTTLYANPFGPEDPRVTAYYTHENPNSSEFELRTWDISASGDLFQLPAGAVGLAVGGEVRTEDFKNIRSKDEIAGNVIGGSEGASVWGTRRVNAAYAEISVPIVKGLQAQVAGRTEHYSDFGSATKPKVAVSYRPTPWLLLRTSFGQSFLAPNLSYLYTSQVTQFSSSSLKDPKRPNDAPRQIQTKSGGNPALQPEETDTIYAGVQFEPTLPALKGLSVSIDAFQFKQTQLISQLGESFILKNEDTLPGKVIRNAPAAGETYGTINYIIDTYDNIDEQTYRGVDVEVAYDFKTSRLGRFRFVASGTYLSEFKLNSTDYAGTYNQPRWRSVFSTTWSKGNWSAAVYANYIGTFENYNEVGDMSSQIIINPQVSYTGFGRTKITLGARNVFDRNPPFDSSASTGWDSDIHESEKQFVYLRVSKDW